MTKIIKLKSEDAMYAVNNGEFNKNLLNSDKKITVIMTQSWCPQWAAMKEWIGNLEKDDLVIYELIYDELECFDEFMNFKETEWNNYNIPYIRYYIDGKLVNESNYTWMEKFLEYLKY